MFEAGMRTTLAQRLVSIVWSVFVQHVLIVWPLTSRLACLVTKQCLMVFGRQTFIVCPGPKAKLLKLWRWYTYQPLAQSTIQT